MPGMASALEEMNDSFEMVPRGRKSPRPRPYMLLCFAGRRSAARQIVYLPENRPGIRAKDGKECFKCLQKKK